MGTGFYHTLLVEMCKSLNIRILTLQTQRLSLLPQIISDIDYDLDEKKFEKFVSPRYHDFDELSKNLTFKQN